jgi:ABC-type transporter Mla maintaining outer membrane lipid asymmetry ATPase subunit MlaF
MTVQIGDPQFDARSLDPVLIDPACASEVFNGSSTGVLGEQGSGKSHLMKLVALRGGPR